MKNIVTGLVLFLLVTSSWAGTLKDNFDDGNLDGWQLFKGRVSGGGSLDESAQWFVEKGELICISKEVCNFSSTFGIGDNTWKDYEFTCQFKVERTSILAGCFMPSFFGIGVHYSDTNGFINGLDVGIWTKDGVWNGNLCERFLQGGFHTHLPGVGINLLIEQGKWYTAQMVVNGNRYEMFLDNKLICNVQSDLPDTGAAAFLARNCEVHFDNVVITGDDIPDKNLGLPVEPKAKLATTWGRIKSNKGKVR